MSSLNHFVRKMNPHNSTPRSWSLEKELWSKLNQISVDTKWSRVEFDKNSIQHIPPKSKGVYLICADTPQDVLREKGLKTVLYAGQSKDLKSRFLEHTRNPKQLKEYLESLIQYTFFYYTKVGDDSRICDLEILLRQTYDPPCNLINPPGTSYFLAHLGPSEEIGSRFHIK